MTLARIFGTFLLTICLAGIAASAQITNRDAVVQGQTAPQTELPQAEQTTPEVPAKPAPQEPSSPEPKVTEPAAQPAPANPPASKKKKHAKKKASPKQNPSEGPTKTVVRNGSTAEPEVKFSPETSTDQQNRQRGKVNYLLTSTDDNLKKISTRQLSDAQQDAVKQIRTYMEQAKSALDEGDLQRGENLAAKARLLSDDLLKH